MFFEILYLNPKTFYTFAQFAHKLSDPNNKPTNSAYFQSVYIKIYM